jgi:hypothetical protein
LGADRAVSFACAPNPGRVVLDVRLTTTAQEVAVAIASLAGYVAGMTDVNIIVPAGVWLWSNSVSAPGLHVNATGTSPYDRLRLINRGAIIGRGGDGGGIQQTGSATLVTNPQAGGAALRVTAGALEIDNTGGYIAGGGGGGGAAASNNSGECAGGGGGAGGGYGGSVQGIQADNNGALGFPRWHGWRRGLQWRRGRLG